MGLILIAGVIVLFAIVFKVAIALIFNENGIGPFRRRR